MNEKAEIFKRILKNKKLDNDVKSGYNKSVFKRVSIDFTYFCKSFYLLKSTN